MNAHSKALGVDEGLLEGHAEFAEAESDDIGGHRRKESIEVFVGRDRTTAVKGADVNLGGMSFWAFEAMGTVMDEDCDGARGVSKI